MRKTATAHILDRCEIFNRKTMRIIKFLILFFLISCNNHKNEVSNLVLKNEKGEDEIAILQNFLKQNGTTYYNLTNKDVVDMQINNGV